MRALRWVLFLPASLVAGKAVVGLGQALDVGGSTAGQPPGVPSYVLALLAGFAFVFAGMLVAPGRPRLVAAALLILMLYLQLPLLVLLGRDGPDPIAFVSTTYISGGVVAAVAGVIMRRMRAAAGVGVVATTPPPIA